MVPAPQSGHSASEQCNSWSSFVSFKSINFHQMDSSHVHMVQFSHWCIFLVRNWFDWWSLHGAVAWPRKMLSVQCVGNHFGWQGTNSFYKGYCVNIFFPFEIVISLYLTRNLRCIKTDKACSYSQNRVAVQIFPELQTRKYNGRKGQNWEHVPVSMRG